MKIGIGAFAAVAVVAAASVGIGRITFERRIAREVEALFAASGTGARSVVTETNLAGLPAPVQWWLRWSQVVGKERPATVRLRQEGRFRQAEDSAWVDFTAVEYYTTEPPGFVWKTTMRMLPLVTITGRDRYADSRGSIDMRLLSLIPVASVSGPALDQGALLRYLNETMWFPAAVLSPYITWEGIDANSAKATMSYGGVTAAATFIFDAEGRLVDMVAQRHDLSRGHLETWSTPIHAYGEFGGIRVPTEGVGQWRYDTGDFTYIEVRITEIEYNRSTPY